MSGRFFPEREHLDRMTEEELADSYAETVEAMNRQTDVVGPSVNTLIARAAFLREELHRRQTQRLTRWMVILTVVIAFLTAANVVLVAFAVLGQ